MSGSDTYTAWSFTPLEVVLHSSPVPFFSLIVSVIVFVTLVIRSQVFVPFAGHFLASPDLALLLILLSTMGVSFFSIGVDALAELNAQGIDSDIGRDLRIRQGRIFAALYLVTLVSLLIAFVIRGFRFRKR